MKSKKLFLFSERNKVIFILTLFFLLTFVNATTIGNMNSRGLNIIVPTTSSSSSGSTFNLTYDTFCINYSLIPSAATSTYNTSYDIHITNLTLHNHTLIYNYSLVINNNYNYNETIESNKSIVIVYDSKWSSTYNVTYHNLINLVYNYSQISNPLIINYSLISLNPNSTILSIYNITNFNYNYNQTVESNKTIFNAYDTEWHDKYNLTYHNKADYLYGDNNYVGNGSFYTGNGIITGFNLKINNSNPKLARDTATGWTYDGYMYFSASTGIITSLPTLTSFRGNLTNDQGNTVTIQKDKLLKFTPSSTLQTCNSTYNGSLTRASNGSLLYCRFGNGVWYVSGGMG